MNEEKKPFWKNPTIMKWGILGALYGFFGPLVILYYGVIFYIVPPFLPSLITFGPLNTILREREVITNYGYPAYTYEGSILLSLIPNLILWSIIGSLFGHFITKLLKKHDRKK